MHNARAQLSDPSDQSHDSLGQPLTHTCHMPSGFDLDMHYMRSLCKAALVVLPAEEVLALKTYLRYLYDTLHDHDVEQQTVRYVAGLLCKIEQRWCRLSEEQKELWNLGCGRPIWDEEGELVSFDVDEESLERVQRMTRNVKTFTLIEDFKKRREMANAKEDIETIEEDDKAEESMSYAGTDGFELDGPGVTPTRHTNNTVSPKNTYFPDCGGSFRDVEVFEAYMERLTKYERMLLVEGILRIVDNPPTNYWKLVEGPALRAGQSLDGLGEQMERLLNEESDSVVNEGDGEWCETKCTDVPSPPSSASWSRPSPPAWTIITEHVQVSGPDYFIEGMTPGSHGSLDTCLRIFGYIVRNMEELKNVYMTLEDDEDNHLLEVYFGLQLVDGKHVLTLPAREAAMHYAKALANLERQYYHILPPRPYEQWGTTFLDEAEWIERQRELTFFELDLIDDGILQVHRLFDGSLLIHEARDAESKEPRAIESALRHERELRSDRIGHGHPRWDEAFRPAEMEGPEWIVRLRSPCAERARRFVKERLAEEIAEENERLRPEQSPRTARPLHTKPPHPTVESEASSQASGEDYEEKTTARRGRGKDVISTPKKAEDNRRMGTTQHSKPCTLKTTRFATSSATSRPQSPYIDEASQHHPSRSPSPQPSLREIQELLDRARPEPEALPAEPEPDIGRHVATA